MDVKNNVAYRKPKNKAEAECFDYLSEQGWTPTKRGWPDFFCINENGDVIVVEVKPTDRHGLKLNQNTVMKALAAAGIPCYKYTPDRGLRKLEFTEG